MKSLNDIVQVILNHVDDNWVNLNKILNSLGLSDIDVLKIASHLVNRRDVEIIYNIQDENFYIRKKTRRESVNNGGKIILQQIVESLRQILKEPIPKPTLQDYLKNLVQDKWETIYNILLRDGVIEEIQISGMTFVKLSSES